MSVISRGYRPVAGASRRAFGIDVTWIGFLAIGAALIVMRRPESLTAAEFTWEEGNAFYVPLFFHPPGALVLEPWGGYLQVVPRLGYELLRTVPVAWAPFADNVLAAAALLALAAYVAGRPLAGLVPSPALRATLGTSLLLLPAQADVMGSWVNVQWHGALWLALVPVASRPKSIPGQWAERALAGLVAFSGPFSTLLAPMFWWRLFKSRTREDAWLAVIVTVAGIVQLGFALLSGRAEVAEPRPLGMTMATLALHLGIVPVLGERLSGAIGDAGIPSSVLFVAALMLIVALVALGGRVLPARAQPLAYAAVAVALSAVVIHGGANIWPPGVNERYFLIGSALVVAIVTVAAARRQPLAVPLVLLLVAAIVTDFRLSPKPYQGWELNNACIGSADPCVVPIWPREYDIHWPGSDGVYVMPEHIDP
jgi:hypothetical protein